MDRPFCNGKNTLPKSNDNLRPGTHISAIGAYMPDKRNIDIIAIKKANIVVDSFE